MQATVEIMQKVTVMDGKHPRGEQTARPLFTGTIVGVPQVDITKPDHGVDISWSGSVLRVNVDGVCALRVCQIPKLTIQGRSLWGK